VNVKDVEKLNDNLQQTATTAPKTSRAIDKVSASTRQLAKDAAAARRTSPTSSLSADAAALDKTAAAAQRTASAFTGVAKGQVEISKTAKAMGFATGLQHVRSLAMSLGGGFTNQLGSGGLQAYGVSDSTAKNTSAGIELGGAGLTGATLGSYFGPLGSILGTAAGTILKGGELIVQGAKEIGSLGNKINAGHFSFYDANKLESEDQRALKIEALNAAISRNRESKRETEKWSFDAIALRLGGENARIDKEYETLTRLRHQMRELDAQTIAGRSAKRAAPAVEKLNEQLQAWEDAQASTPDEIRRVLTRKTRELAVKIDLPTDGLTPENLQHRLTQHVEVLTENLSSPTFKTRDDARFNLAEIARLNLIPQAAAITQTNNNLAKKPPETPIPASTLAPREGSITTPRLAADALTRIGGNTGGGYNANTHWQATLARNSSRQIQLFEETNRLLREKLTLTTATTSPSPAIAG
ncbi:MAG: hypothetical protein LBS59_00975, partial [Puniceicoccales bacterium]|jgi:hypothetical protein|nr:hypothetical protein [Puniceicoccales bacterium]